MAVNEGATDVVEALIQRGEYAQRDLQSEPVRPT